MLDDPGVLAWNRRDDYMPYWAYLWPGAFLLAEAIAAERWPVGMQALEIGCGLGLAGLAGIRAGLHVTFSDYDEGPLDFVRQSAESNGFAPSSYETRNLNWRDAGDASFPLILGADVLYERRLVPLVVGVLARMLASGGLALIADPYRASAEGFAPAVEELGMTCTTTSVTAESAELGGVRGILHRVQRPSSTRRECATRNRFSLPDGH
jgi:hypothetical protein